MLIHKQRQLVSKEIRREVQRNTAEDPVEHSFKRTCFEFLIPTALCIKESSLILHMDI